MIDKVTIHCSDTPNGLNVSIDAIRMEHLSRGFGGIGYHWIIQPSGLRVATRPENEVGAHVANMNKGNIGICLAGHDRFTLAQFKSLRETINRYALDLKMVTANNIWCHSEFASARSQGKTCPNMRAVDIAIWWALGTLAPEEKCVDNIIAPYLYEPGKQLN